MSNDFLTWCDERTAACKAAQQRLSGEGRTDEATMMIIRANVYGIFRTTWTAVKGDASLVLSRLDSIPSTWATRLAQAEQHGDDVTAHIERVKLETVEDIRRRILQEADHD